MAINPIEFQGTVARAQDYTTLKHNEDHKGVVDQTNFQNHFAKEVNDKTHQVQSRENPDNPKGKFDAKEKGNGQYAGDGGQKRKDQSENELFDKDGKVKIKGRSSFDIKI